jgi:TolB-like protein/DNA-binding winged helix-turn-helix (wHTH) protein/tetratricopeptide (TPR) repeat protein
MNATEKETSVFRFESYTADLRSGELRKFGTRIPLQIQPFQVLSVFLEKPNELVTREELQRKLWPSDTFVDFDHGLNKAINKLRDALCDTAEEPRFIETVPRRGYRFVAPVVIELPHAADPEPEAPEVIPTTVAVQAPVATRPSRFVIWALALAAVASAVFFSAPRVMESNAAPSLAVLPLLAQGSTADYDVADGMTDALIDDLSRVPGLKVISHASVFQYRNRPVDPRVAGRQLGVAAVLTGRVEQTGSTLRVLLELTSTKDGSHIWGQQYAEDVAERAALQSKIVAAVGDSLRVTIATERQRRIPQARVDADAQQLYYKARYYFFKETPEDVTRARSFFWQAIDRDPTYALAWAGVGDTYDWMATDGFQPLNEVVRQAAEAKQKANELDSNSAEVHSSLAAFHMVQWQWPNAEIEFQRSLALNPNRAEGHGLYSIYLRTMKRFPEALRHANKVVELDPLSMQRKSGLALTYFYARQYDAAARQYRLIVKEYPDAAGAHAGLSSVLLRMGKEKEAIEEWAQSLSLAGDGRSADNLRRAYAIGGLRAARMAVLGGEIRELQQVAAKSYVSPLEFAYRYALLNDKENAFHWLEKAYAERTPQLFNLNVDPDYDNLRNDARFSDLLARLHVPT